MLDALRRGAQGWVAKILFSILLVSFAVWGIGDFVGRVGQGNVATVGDVDIPVQQFQNAYRNEIAMISEQSNNKLTPEQAVAVGLPQRTLDRLIASSAIEAHAHKIGLGLSDEVLGEQIRQDPSFAGPEGTFQPFIFSNSLAQAGLSERGYLEIRRREETRKQIVNALTSGITPPEAMQNLVHNWNNETRIVEHFTIDAATAVKVADPDEAKIKETYETEKASFTSPEYRKLAVLIAGPDDAKKRITITDEDLKVAYDLEKESYNTPEQRRIQQIAFKDKAAAAAAKDALVKGKSFGDIAKDAGAKDTDVDLGLVAKKDLIDPIIADAAFALEKDKVSDVVEGRFTNVLIRVTEIKPAVTKTFDEVKEQVRDKIAKERAGPEIQKIHDDVDDNKLAGKPLKEIAEKLKLTFAEIPATDAEGRSPDDKPVLERPDTLYIIRAAFDAKKGGEPEPVELADGGYAWVTVDSITEAKAKPFDEVKDKVKEKAIEIERKKLATELSAKLVERLNNGEPADKPATEAGTKLDKSQPMTRTSVPQSIPQSVATIAFALPLNRAAATDSLDGKSRTVFKLVEIKPPEALAAQGKDQLKKDLESDLQTDLVAGYIDGLQKKLGVSINQVELKRATGVGDSQ